MGTLYSIVEAAASVMRLELSCVISSISLPSSVILDPEMKEAVVHVTRHSNRLMLLKLVLQGEIVIVISVKKNTSNWRVEQL